MAAPRTYLFVPGDRPERFAKALASGADAIVLDLEDAVAPVAKTAARHAVASWLAGTPERAQVVVRINDASTAWFADDVLMLAASGATAVMLAKAENVATIAQLRAACPHIHALPLVESARGMLTALALAAAPGVQRLVFGTIDYALDLDLGSDPLALDAGHAHLALGAVQLDGRMVDKPVIERARRIIARAS